MIWRLLGIIVSAVLTILLDRSSKLLGSLG